MVYKTYNINVGTFISETFPSVNDGYVFTLGANPEPPAWFDFLDGTFGGLNIFTGYQFTAPLVPGTYIIGFLSGILDSEVAQEIVINVLAENNTLEYENCCGDRNIAWLNIQGGWQNYIFTGVKTFELKIGKDSTFKTSSLIKKKSEVGGVYNGEILTTGDIPKTHVDILASLQHCIQAFLFNEETEKWEIPIVVDSNSFVKYKSNDKFFEFKLRFIYAEEILVQTQ